MEKTVETLGDLFAADAYRLIQRHRPLIPWLELLEPVIKRSSGRTESTARFARQEVIPRQPRRDHGDALAVPTENEGEPIDPMTRDRLRPVFEVDPLTQQVQPPGSRYEIEQARIHTDSQADRYARAQGADAVTVGRDIYFRQGAYAPQSAPGFGLLAHEVTHVSENERPGAAQQRDTVAGVRDEERRARGREQIAAQWPVSPVVAPAYARPQVASAPDSPSPQVAPGSNSPIHPMRADEDRPPVEALPAPTQAAPNLDQLRRGLFRDLMNQIRVEFERGA